MQKIRRKIQHWRAEFECNPDAFDLALGCALWTGIYLYLPLVVR